MTRALPPCPAWCVSRGAFVRPRAWIRGKPRLACDLGGVRVVVAAGDLVSATERWAAVAAEEEDARG